ncbi:MBL fold metallo-hydrolase [Comamonas serinivorans]|uniref:MBL fold metallo-hydrolase n=1 Tax=Comamonas serinivorans TaxID=1082851 RepID=A0A1Y0ELS2_9BURK|nr:MBL fold metallo-hydrolase [Comamonas serinivorans]ARU04567.1 MBL fold metallo-hydrolase [Comamonas serinivorans]
MPATPRFTPPGRPPRLHRAGLHRASLITLACVASWSCTSVPSPEEAQRLAESPQYSAETQRFRNAPNAAAKPSAGGWAIWSRFLFGSKTGTVPVDAIPVQPITRAQLEALPQDANHIIRLGHSSHLLKLQGQYWLIDPVFGERASPFSFMGPKRFHATPLPLSELPPIAGLVLSHDHYDHLDVPTIAFLRDKVQRFFVPLRVGARLQDLDVDASRVTELDWWGEAEHAGVKLTAAPAQHFSGRTLTDRDSTLWASWSLESGGQRIYYSGDSGYFDGFKAIGERLGPFDVALMENGAYDSYWPAVHMSPEESVQAFQDVRGQVLYGVHNSTFDLAFHTWQDPLERLATLAEQKGIPVATPVIGEVLTIGQPRTNVRWWQGLR